MIFAKKPIALLPIGEIPEIRIKSVAAHIEGYFNLCTEILPPLANPLYAFHKKRLQYSAAAIIDKMAPEVPEDYEKIIGLVDVDIFVPILTYVFGEAQQGGRCAVVSFHRLKKNSDGSSPTEAQVLERSAKIALHELGHLFGLYHCTDDKCLMHFCGDLDELDKTPLSLCRYCSVFLREALRRGR